MTDSVIIVGIGNPNVDYVIRIEDDYLLRKYNLVPNSQAERSSELLSDIKEDAEKNEYLPKYSAGGCTQNTLRIFQWLIKSAFRSAMIGAVGTDTDAIQLRKLVESCNVITEYVEIPQYATANVIVLTYKDTRTAIASLGAAKKFTIDHFTEKHRQLLNKSAIIFTEGFFAVNCVAVCNYLFENYATDKLLMFNIAGVYIFRTDSNQIVTLCKKADVVIGNREEFLELASCLGLSINDDVPTLLKQFYKIMLTNGTRKNSTKFPAAYWSSKIVIVTDAERPIYYIFKEDAVMKEDVVPVNPDDLVDTTGAGDAFTAGFIYGIVNNRQVPTSVRIGCKVAKRIIQQDAVSCPNDDPQTVISS